MKSGFQLIEDEISPMVQKVLPVRIAIFASGSGTNTQRLAEYFKRSEVASVIVILTNNPGAGVIRRAKELEIPCIILPQNTWLDGLKMLEILKEYHIELVVLAGYLKLIPVEVIRSFKGRIVNIHPALLPAYGGKGMYGRNVHEAVLGAHEKTSGITIHFVTEEYDKGEIIRQVALNLSEGMKSEELEKEIHRLEHQYYPQEVEKLCIQISEKRSKKN